MAVLSLPIFLFLLPPACQYYFLDFHGFKLNSLFGLFLLMYFVKFVKFAFVIGAGLMNLFCFVGLTRFLIKG